MGGVAEDALLHGAFTRDHATWTCSSSGHVSATCSASFVRMDIRRGDERRGEPFYLASRERPVLLEIGVADRTDGADLFMEIATDV